MPGFYNSYLSKKLETFLHETEVLWRVQLYFFKNLHSGGYLHSGGRVLYMIIIIIKVGLFLLANKIDKPNNKYQDFLKTQTNTV